MVLKQKGYERGTKKTENFKLMEQTSIAVCSWTEISL